MTISGGVDVKARHVRQYQVVMMWRPDMYDNIRWCWSEGMICTTNVDFALQTCLRIAHGRPTIIMKMLPWYQYFSMSVVFYNGTWLSNTLLSIISLESVQFSDWGGKYTNQWTISSYGAFTHQMQLWFVSMFVWWGFFCFLFFCCFFLGWGVVCRCYS